VKIKKKLIIINLSKNYSHKINEINCDCINISSGQINIGKSNILDFFEIRKKYFKVVKKIFVDSYLKKILEIKKKIPYFFEIETFNLRNDKNKSIDFFLNILLIKEYIKKNHYNEIELITDHEFDSKIFKDLSSKILVNKFGTKKIENKWLILKFTKFYFKAFLICFVLKFFQKNYEIRRKIVLSIYPLFSNKTKENFFKDEKSLKLNFLLTDETHLNASFFKILKNLKEYKSNNVIHAESLIGLLSIIKVYLLGLFEIFKISNKNLILKIDKIDYSLILQNDFYQAFLNRLKLNIYKKSLESFFLNKKIKSFHYYMFEYNFGFFLNNLIRKTNKDILRIGYQHGIFSSNLLWLVLFKKFKKEISPNELVYFSELSKKTYNHYFKNIKKKKRVKITSNLLKKIKYSQKKNCHKILVLPGTHDAYEILNSIKNKINYNNEKKIYYFKFHPKMNISLKNSKYLKKISNIENHIFSEVYISQTSTLVYDFINEKKKFKLINLNFKMNLLSKNDNKKLKYIYFN